MTGARILLVEDDAEQREGLALLLRGHGYTVAEAASAEAAMTLLEAGTFDLIVTDYQLGGATGSWLARIAASRMQPAAPRILLMTGQDHIGDSAGLPVLYKPLDVPRFLAHVAQTLAAPHYPAEEVAAPAQRIAFILYVTDSVPSQRARAALERLLAAYDPSQVALSVVNLSRQRGHQAEEHRIVVTPTLLKTFPAPRLWIAGGGGEPAVVERLLQQAGVEARR